MTVLGLDGGDLVALLAGAMVGGSLGVVGSGLLAAAGRGDRLLGIPGEGEQDRRRGRW